MNEKQIATETKQQNILDMALTFTAMVRIFKVDSKSLILNKLTEFCDDLQNISSAKNFEDKHHEFCLWFVKNISTAEKTLKNGKIKKSSQSSYGHAAKTLDIVLKVFIFYSHLPSDEHSKKLIPLLHAAIDTPILNYLKKNYPCNKTSASTIEQIDEEQYKNLQKLIGKDLIEKYQSMILPVEYDDILWNKLNRASKI